MTVERTHCRRAFDLDLVAFVHDARGARWADFREHYPLCVDCRVEVRTWTELEIVLQGGAPLATAHPTPDDLLQLESGGSALEPEYRRVVEFHVASCRPCADEIATLRAFDFTQLDQARTNRVAMAEPSGSPELPAAARGLVPAEALHASVTAVEPDADPTVVPSATAEGAPASVPSEGQAHDTLQADAHGGVPLDAGDADAPIAGDQAALAVVGEDGVGAEADDAMGAGDEAALGVAGDEGAGVEGAGVEAALGAAGDAGAGDEAALGVAGEAALGAPGHDGRGIDDEAVVGLEGRDEAGAEGVCGETESAVEALAPIDEESAHAAVASAVEAGAATGAEREVAGDAVVATDALPAEAATEVGAVVPDAGFLPPEALVEGFSGAGEPVTSDPATRGFGRRMGQAMRHPATGVSLVVALLLPVLWVGKLPNFPFGAPAGRVLHELPDVRVAVATVDDPIAAPEPPALEIDAASGAEEDLALEFPSALTGIEAEALPPPQAEPGVQIALAKTDLNEPTRAPGLLVPDETAEPSQAIDPWALTRLDDEGPVEIVATHLAAGLELEVPVPLTVPAGAVLQVQIRGEGSREIVERLSFPGAQQIAMRVPAAWLVPGTYQVDVGVIRRGPAPVQVASYTLVVH